MCSFVRNAVLVHGSGSTGIAVFIALGLPQASSQKKIMRFWFGTGSHGFMKGVFDDLKRNINKESLKIMPMIIGREPEFI